MRPLIAVGLFAVFACSGRIDDGAPGDPPPEPDGGIPPLACGMASAAAPWRAVPVTREQYINSVSDLLGFDVRPLTAFSDLGSRKLTRGVSLSPLQVEERLSTAEAIAASAASPAHLTGLLPCDPATGASCAGQLIEQLATRAFRRPPTPEATAALRRLFDAGAAAGGFATGVEYLVDGILQSPDFLYQLAPRPAAKPGAITPLDDYTLAARLAFFLWNSAPDPELLSAAGAGGLRTPDGIGAQVRRMTAHARSARMREDYYGNWLKLGDLDQISRDARELTPALIQDLKRSAIQTIHDLYRTGAKVDALWDSATLFANDAFAKVYALPPTPGVDLVPVAASPAERHGILTHPALLTLLANPDSSDPIKRGVFVEEEVLCQTLPEAIPDIPDLPPLRAGLSTRARLEQHRSAPACAACHAMFDPIGMAFENYDPIGRFRTTDQKVPVDSSGEIKQGIDLDGKFANGMELLARFGRSNTVRDCMVRRWFEYAVSRDVDASEACALQSVQTRFRSSGDLQDLLTSIAESDAFRSQVVEP